MAAQINHAKRMRDRAATIRGETNGNISGLREGVADLLEAVASIIETGYVTPSECSAFHETLKKKLKPRFGWPAFAAVFTGCGTVIGALHMLIKG
jgi:hypothetical protein